MAMRRRGKRSLTGACIALAMVMAGAVPASSAPGDEDPTFSGDGVATFNVTTVAKSDARVNDVAAQSDGKVVAVGSSRANSSGSDTNILTARYNTDGSLDTSYNGDGIGTGGFGPGADVAYAVTLDSDGRAVFVGDSAGRMVVGRVKADGFLDPTFNGGAGAIAIDIPTSSVESFRAVAIDGIGRIIAAGYEDLGTGGDFVVARFNIDGTNDTSFGFNGYAVTDLGGHNAAEGIAIQLDGKIVVGGASGLVRYDATGALDGSFGIGGKVQWTGLDCTLSCGLALDATGIVMAGGGCDSAGGSCGVLVRRATSSGTVDGSFGGGDGQVAAPFGAPDAATDVVITATGQIVAVGYGSGGTGAQDVAIARFTSDGVLDTSFASFGQKLVSFNGDGDEGLALAIDRVGNLIIGGHKGDSTDPSSSLLGIARLLSNGTTDTSFDLDGVALTPVPIILPTNDYIADVAVGPLGNIVTAGGTDTQGVGQSDFAVASTDQAGVTSCCARVDFGNSDDYAEAVLPGSGYTYVVGGSAAVGGEGRFALAKVVSGGTLDPSFDGDGRVTTSFPAHQAYAYDATVDSSGHIVVVGEDNGDIAMARYNPDGSLDGTFGTGGTVVLDVGPALVHAASVAIDPVGRIVIGVNDNAALNAARFTSVGALDVSFGTGGRASLVASGARTAEVAIDGSGRILVAGTIIDGGHFRMAAARFTGDGVVDTYGTNGLAVAAFGPTTDDSTDAAVVDPLGRLVVAGETNGHIALARFTATGTPDGGFGAGGYSETPTPTASRAFGLTTDGSGRLVAAGFVDTNGNGDDSIIVRYQSPPPDTISGTGTASTGSNPTPSDPVETSVTNPIGGSITITEQTITSSTAAFPAPTGYTLLDQQVTISTPATNDPNNPLLFTFVVDSSELTAAGVDIQHLEVLRNGVPVPNCTNPTVAVASPDPCVFDRSLDGNGDGHIGVYTSAASAWTFAKKVPVAATSFYGGVKLPTAINSAKAGTAVSLKFTLGGDFGLDIFASGYPKMVDCNADPLSAGSLATGVLSYDSTTQRYTYAWKTPKSFVTTCKQLVLRFKDGSVLRANYSFTK